MPSATVSVAESARLVGRELLAIGPGENVAIVVDDHSAMEMVRALVDVAASAGAEWAILHQPSRPPERKNELGPVIEAAFEKTDVLISLTGSCGAPAYAARVKELLTEKRLRTMSMVMRRPCDNFTSGGALADYRALHAEGQALAAICAAGRRRGAQAMVNDRTRYRPAREVPHGAPSLEIRKEVARPLHHLVFGIRPIVEQWDEGMLVQLAARPSATRSRAHTRLAHRTCRGRPRGDGSGRSSSGIRADDPAPGQGADQRVMKGGGANAGGLAVGPEREHLGQQVGTVDRQIEADVPHEGSAGRLVERAGEGRGPPQSAMEHRAAAARAVSFSNGDGREGFELDPSFDDDQWAK